MHTTWYKLSHLCSHFRLWCIFFMAFAVYGMKQFVFTSMGSATGNEEMNNLLLNFASYSQILMIFLWVFLYVSKLGQVSFSRLEDILSDDGASHNWAHHRYRRRRQSRGPGVEVGTPWDDLCGRRGLAEVGLADLGRVPSVRRL